MKKSKTDRRARAADRLKAQVSFWKRQKDSAKDRLTKAKTEDTRVSAETALATAARKLAYTRNTLANTLANMTVGSAEAKQYVREQSERQSA